jgi:hypothetical protein
MLSRVCRNAQIVRGEVVEQVSWIVFGRAWLLLLCITDLTNAVLPPGGSKTASFLGYWSAHQWPQIEVLSTFLASRSRDFQRSSFAYPGSYCNAKLQTVSEPVDAKTPQ